MNTPLFSPLPVMDRLFWKLEKHENGSCQGSDVHATGFFELAACGQVGRILTTAVAYNQLRV
ncbi:hypothetical protein PAXRUDRAFT_397817 [Paxillus rubicundulus Ve08.2h10]|uniref:Uncharacterized protein n=1 Tax=Paxillus rubicundulus Ve08.2h10 TaxID=930991 RepID=A0A0D0E349_9AGAM|nr:hypothetical protein PAXRUDRAFT_397817 [Paxillus rubicundulus Ve08.2h10]